MLRVICSLPLSNCAFLYDAASLRLLCRLLVSGFVVYLQDTGVLRTAVETGAVRLLSIWSFSVVPLHSVPLPADIPELRLEVDTLAKIWWVKLSALLWRYQFCVFLLC